MKLKEAKVCCAFAWSPAAIVPDGGRIRSNMIAGASVAGAMDDTFSSDAFLKIYDVDLGAGIQQRELPVLGQTSMPDRAHRIDWGAHGGSAGLIAAGLVDSTVCVWSAEAILKDGTAGEANGVATGAFDGPAPNDVGLVCRISQHQGAVKACQFNPLQPHFLATGGADKELFIWNLQDPSQPLSVPACAKSTQASEIVDVRWNPKFAHIMATSTAGGNVTVWDLRSKRSACTFQVAPSACAAASIAWHPEVATFIAVARDDPLPAVQIWDLKKAMAPTKELTAHTGGVLGLSWCAEDSGLLVSCGRDGRTIYWNPTTGEQLGEHARSENWVYDVKFAARAPAVIATASFDQQLSVHTSQDVVTSRSAAPKWLKRPAPAAFGFGGRISLPDKNCSLTEAAGPRVIRLKTQLNKDSNVVADDAQFRKTLQDTRTPADRAAWLAAEPKFADAVVLASMVSAKSRDPLMTTLDLRPDAVSSQVESSAATAVDLPAATVEQLLASGVATGKLTSAITLCIAAGRFADAFAIAHVSGAAEVKRVQDAYLQAKSQESRLVAYVGALTTGNFGALAEGPHAASHWKEILALYATYLKPEQFAPSTAGLGQVLERAGQPDHALAAYVAGGHVDLAAPLLKSLRGLEDRDLVSVVTLLEQSAQRECKSETFGAALANHAGALSAAGAFAPAMAYASRAAKIGVKEAAVVADRMQHFVPAAERLKVDFPFGTRGALPEPSTPETQILASQQRPVGVAPQPAAKASPAPAAQHHHDPRAVGPAPVAHHATPPPPVQPSVTHPVAPVQPPMPQPPMPPVHHQPPVHQPPLPVQPPPVSQPPVSVAPLPVAPAPTPIPRPTTLPGVVQPARPAAAPAAATAPAVSTEGVADDAKPVVARVNEELAKLADKRVKASVEKALAAFVAAAPSLPAELKGMIVAWSTKIGTAEAKSEWAKLSEGANWSHVQSFNNLKFV